MQFGKSSLADALGKPTGISAWGIGLTSHVSAVSLPFDGSGLKIFLDKMGDQHEYSPRSKGLGHGRLGVAAFAKEALRRARPSGSRTSSGIGSQQVSREATVGQGTLLALDSRIAAFDGLNPVRCIIFPFLGRQHPLWRRFL